MCKKFVSANPALPSTASKGLVLLESRILFPNELEEFCTSLALRESHSAQQHFTGSEKPQGTDTHLPLLSNPAFLKPEGVIS